MKFKHIIIFTIILVLSACSKQEETLEVQNIETFDEKSATIEGSEIIVTAKKNKTKSNIYSLDVNISNKLTKETLPTFVHTFKSDNKAEDISDLPNKFSKFNGVFTITVGDRIISQSVIRNGLVIQSKRDPELTSTVGEYDCTVDGITSCADDQINDMNWIEYGFCAVSAPACLARLYSSCLWENC